MAAEQSTGRMNEVAENQFAAALQATVTKMVQAQTLDRRVSTITPEEIKEITTKIKEITDVINVDWNEIVKSIASFLVYESFSPIIIRKMTLLNSSTKWDKLAEMVDFRDPVTNVVSPISHGERYAKLINMAVLVVLTRGTNMAVSSKNYNRTSPEGQMIVKDVVEKFKIKDVKNPAKYEVTFSRIVASFPELAANIMAHGYGRVVGEVPASLPAYFAFPGAASVIPDELLTAYTVYAVSFDRAIKRNKNQWTPVQRIKQYIEAGKQSDLGRYPNDRKAKLGMFGSDKDYIAWVQKLAEFAKTQTQKLEFSPMGAQTYDAILAEIS